AAALCGDLPLALTTFAGTLRTKTIPSVGDLIARLREGKDKLGPVERAFEVSAAMLPDPIRRAWYRLSVFPVSFDLAAACAVIGGAKDTAEASMQALVDASLVEHDEASGRFRLHDLVRQHGDARLGDEERREVRLAHARRFIEVGRTCDHLYD